MIIRPEQTGDEITIHEITVQAFESMPFSNGSEAPIIKQLRKDEDLTISQVAVIDDQIVGHIAFSPITINGAHDDWFGLGPVAVKTDLQNRGIGKKLIMEGLAQLKSRNASGCALIGNPDYYGRFGFRSDGQLHYGDVPDQFVQWLSFGSERAVGVLRFAPAFEQ